MAELLLRKIDVRKAPGGWCGVPGEDQTHRVIDAIAERYRAGDDEIDLAADYDIDVLAVAACLIWTAHDRPPRPDAKGSSVPNGAAP